LITDRPDTCLASADMKAPPKVDSLENIGRPNVCVTSANIFLLDP